MNLRRQWLGIVLGATLSVGCGGRPAPPPPDEAARRIIQQEQSIDVATLALNSLGVPPFSVDAADTTVAPLGYGLADLLLTDLARSSKLQVVDRVRLDAILRELQLVESGRVDDATAPRVGKLAGARRLVLGSLRGNGSGTLRVDARVADVASGEIRGAVDADAPLEDILDAEKALAYELFDQLGVTLTPAERALVEQRPTRNIAALLAYSRGVRFQAEGRYDEAAREYREAARLDPGFAAPGTRLAEVESPEVAGSPEQVPAEGGSVSRAAGIAIDRLNGVPVTPLGSQQTTGPTDPSFPAATATVIIIVDTD